MTSRERVVKYLDSKGISRYRFYKTTGLSNGFLDKKGNIRADLCEKICSHFEDLDLNWLITGKGEMLKGEIPVKNFKKLGSPYYNVDFMANFELVYNNQTANPDYYIDFEPFNIPGAVWCNVSGKSMEPEISNGDMVLIKEVPSWQDYLDFDDIYGIVTCNGFRTIKRVKKGSSKDTFTLVPANPDYESQEIKKEMIAHIFKVLCAVKKF